MRALILITLIVCAVAVSHKTLSTTEKKQYETLRKSGTWGGIMLGLAEMHLMTNGPVDALVKGVQAILADLNVKVEEADAAFQKRTDENASEVRRLTDLINEANRQIADTQEALANNLYPLKAQIQESIADRERFIENSETYIADQTNIRQLSNAHFLVRVQETQDAFAAISEATVIINQLLGNEASSFTQVKIVKKVMDKVGEKLQKTKGVDKYFVKALVALATGEFADSAALQRVISKLEEVAANLGAATVADTNNEQLEAVTYAQDMSEKAQAIAEAQDQTNNLNQQLIETEEVIAANEAFVISRQYDIVKFQSELDSEQAQYEEATAVYNDLSAQFAKEQVACQDALDIVENASFADYIGARVEQDRVIDNQHGSGIATGAGTFDFQNNRIFY